jgi:hypothetical protein
MKHVLRRLSQNKVEIDFYLNGEEVAFLTIEKSHHEREIIALYLFKAFGERTAFLMLFDRIAVDKSEAIEFWLEQADLSLDNLHTLF